MEGLSSRRRPLLVYMRLVVAVLSLKEVRALLVSSRP